VLLLVGPHEPEKRDAIPSAVLDAASRDGGLILAGYRHDMPELYALMDVFVLPSYREGLPQTLMEAASMGVPAVTTDVRGCREIVEDGATGLVVPAGRPSALADALLRLLRDTELAAGLGLGARSRARARYDERMVFSRLEEIYAELLRHSMTPRSTWLRRERAS
jgi:glycosyltransferase involved in cell wall biosynthesis